MSNDKIKIPFYNDLNFMIDNCEGLILDIWGVLWDGIKVYPEALTTLIELRKKEIPIILLSNAPRKSEIVVNKLENIGIKPYLYDKIISSGDVCRNELITNNDLVPGINYYFIGLKEDDDLYNIKKFIKDSINFDNILTISLENSTNSQLETVLKIKNFIDS